MAVEKLGVSNLADSSVLICYFVVGSVVGSVVEGNESSVGAPFIQIFQTN
jgi:hypothetical protein